MVDALRAALRLLPVVKSSPGGTCVGCSRASLVRRHTSTDQSLLFSLTTPQQPATFERPQNTVTGLARFARAVLTYVGVGLSAVTANQLTGNSLTVHAKEIGKNRRDGGFMASEEARTSWRNAANKHFLTQEELETDIECSDLLSSTQATESKKATVEEEEGFLCLPTNGWESADMTDLPWQFGPSSYIMYGPDCVSLEKPSVSRSRKLQTDSDMQMKKASYGESSDMEMEWHWLINQQQAESNCCGMPPVQTKDAYKEIADESFEEVVHDALEEFPEVDQVVEMMGKDGELSTKSTLSKTDLNGELSLSGAVSSKGRSGNLSLELNREKHSVSGAMSSQGSSGNLVVEMNGEKLEHKDSASWRTADIKELAALVSQKTPKCLENCDLPVSQSSSTRKGSLASCDLSLAKTAKFDFSKSVDRILLASLLYGNEPTSLENRSLPSSPLILRTSDPTPLQKRLPKISQPLTISPFRAPSSTTRRNKLFSLDGKSTSWNGSGGNVSGSARGSDTLGEALCHSQTRAREAEKAAAQAVKEKEQLQHLLLREASLSLTYRQWVRLLELENMWLKMHIRDRSVFWMEHAYINPSVAFERLSNNRWKHFGRRFAHKQMQHVSSFWQGKEQYCKWASERSNVVVGYTIGLAFALGLSLAGAGFMIGWSLGWLFLAY